MDPDQREAITRNLSIKLAAEMIPAEHRTERPDPLRLESEALPASDKIVVESEPPPRFAADLFSSRQPLEHDTTLWTVGAFVVKGAFGGSVRFELGHGNSRITLPISKFRLPPEVS